MSKGLRFTVRDISEQELEAFYNWQEIRMLKKRGWTEQQFWHKSPHLPIYTKQGWRLKPWGNQDAFSELPKGHWAKLESVRDGKWAHFDPKPVLITAYASLDAGLWLDLVDGLTGLIVKKDGQEVVYLLTKPAEPAYHALTGQDRQPVGNFIYPQS